MSDQLLAEITHIIFDLDGLLIDTESCYTTATNNIVSKYGKQFPFDLKKKVMGKNPKDSSLIIIQELDLPFEWQQFLDLLNAEFEEVVKDVELMPGAEQLVKHLYKTNIPMAIGTGSNSSQFATKTAKFNDFFIKSNFFNHYVLAGDDPHVKRGKPFPDVFIETMKRFNADLKPENVLVFEDSLLGVDAAVAANMPVVWVPDPRHDITQHKATIVLKSLEEFRPELFGLSSIKPIKS